MHRHLFRAWLTVTAALALLGAGSGCGPGGGLARGDEERNPYFRSAQQAVEAKDYTGAATLYRKALRVNPDLANAHLELALVYDDKLHDPVAAIYHYRQYLELKPGSDKRQVVEDFIERAKLALAAKLPQAALTDSGELARLQAERANLVQENASLLARVRQLESAPGEHVARPATPTTTTVPPPPPPARIVTPPPATVSTPPPVTPRTVHPPPTAPPPTVATTTPPRPAANPRVRTHVVQKGDTLYSLALQYYGTRSMWAKIYQANRPLIPERDQLKIGQPLVIPVD